jgi:hypothetical protein
MKSILSLSLSFVVCCTGLATLGVAPARAQQVAASVSLDKLREQYEQLLAIDRDPSTSAAEREVNRPFLEQRRAQLGDALKAKLATMRRYQANASALLTEQERGQLAQSIRDAEAQLRDLLRGAASAAGATLARRTPPARRTAAASGRTPRASSVAALATNDEAEPAPADEPGGDAGDAPKPVEPPKPIAIASPADGSTLVVDKVQLEIAVNDDSIDDVMVNLYEGDNAKPCAGCGRTLEIKRSDKGKKTVGVSLRKGVNRIEVTSKQKPDAKAVAKVTYATDEPVAIGSSGGGQNVAAPAAKPSKWSSTSEKWTNVPEEGTNVRVGYTGEADKSYQFYLKKRDGSAAQNIDATMKPGISGTISAVFPELNAGDLVGVAEMDDEAVAARDEIAVESPLDDVKGGPVGLLVGGVVMSQQAQEFQQADPFFGFTVGYMSKMRNAYKRSKKKECGQSGQRFIRTNVEGLFATDGGFGVKCVDGKWTQTNSRITRERADAAFVRNTGFNGFRWNLRFQGIFQSDPRTATTTDTTTTDGSGAGGGGSTTTNEPFTFIASRKTFDLNTQLWVDFWANSAFSIGPYVSVGASSVLDKNELQGEAVTDGEGNSAGEGGDANTNAVATQSVSDNDLKKYFEGGVLMNIMLNRDLFAQSILAYRHDEALAGLHSPRSGCFSCNTQNRFAGKLRVFPFGLNRGFGRQIKMAPMFGVEVNAGRGPDHLKFFSGFAMRIKGINVGDAAGSLAPAEEKPAGEKPAGDDPQPAGDDHP